MNLSVLFFPCKLSHLFTGCNRESPNLFKGTGNFLCIGKTLGTYPILFVFLLLALFSADVCLLLALKARSAEKNPSRI